MLGDEDPEIVMDEEPEEHPEEEEEIDEEPDEDGSEEEPDEDPEGEETEAESEEDPEEEYKEEINERSDNPLPQKNYRVSSSATGGGIASYGFENELNKDPEASGSDAGLFKVIASGGYASIQEEGGRGSGRPRRSRLWDLKQEGETPQIDGKGKRRKTRWDNNDTPNGSSNSSNIINLLELSTDPKIKSLKLDLMKISKKLLNASTASTREKLLNKSKAIISELAMRNLRPAGFVKKLFVPVKEYPTYNFIGLILGPKGKTQKRMEKETGTKIFLRGKGSRSGEAEDQDLHVQVEASNQQALDAAVAMVEKLLIPVPDENNEHKKAQLVELAKIRGTYKDQNTCDLCKEQGHRTYACPLQNSTFEAVCCDKCGSFGHSTSNCSVFLSPPICKGSTEPVVDLASLYVGYLSEAIDEQRLKELFLPFGKIVSTKVNKDQTTGLSKGYGFVKFENPSDAAAAVTYMNGYKMEGKMLAVRIAGKRPVAVPLISAHVPINSLQTAVPSNVLGQTSFVCGPTVSMLPQAQFSTGPTVSMLPQAQFSTGPMVSVLPQAQFSIAKNGSLGFPSSSVYSGTDRGIARNEALNFPAYVVSSKTDPMATNNFSSGYDFCDRIPSSLPNSESMFPGHPDYPASQFKSYFTNPVMNETPNQIPETTEKRSTFSFASRFP